MLWIIVLITRTKLRKLVWWDSSSCPMDQCTINFPISTKTNKSGASKCFRVDHLTISIGSTATSASIAWSHALLLSHEWQRQRVTIWRPWSTVKHLLAWGRKISPLDMRTLLLTYFGIDIPRTLYEKSISKLSTCLWNISSDTVIECWMQISFEYAHLEVNHTGSIFEVNPDTFGHMTTYGSIKYLWTFVQYLTFIWWLQRQPFHSYIV